MSALLSKMLGAKVLMDQGDYTKALATLMPLAARNPRDAELASLLSVVLYRARKFDQGLHYARRAVELSPADPNLHSNLALLCDACGKRDLAHAALLKAVQLSPTHPDARLSLANRALDDHRTTEALEHCEAALKAGMHAEIAMTYSGALMALGEVERAVAFTREAIRQIPGSLSLWGGLCAGLNYLYGAGVAETAAAHREYGRLLAQLRPPAQFKHAGTRDPDRVIRVGFVSSDLRTHSVSFFMEPFFELHDKGRFEVHVFSTTRHPDATSERLGKLVHRWHNCADLIDVEMARLAEREGIDILVDLGGHTLFSQLTLFEYKPAPVQVTYCGYPNTTGLTSIDYRIIDSLTDPVRDARIGAALLPDHPDFDERCTEKLVRLDPCFLCYQPPRDAPTPMRDRSASPGTVFGSFNANKKIGAGVIALWAKVLHRVPGSRLIMKTFELKDPPARARVLREFAACGIDASRLEILDPTKGIAEHLAKYALVDVALDSLPYNGTTTTCEALWMGVPVVALAGATHAARVGASLLTTVGLPELIAPDEPTYVDLACELAADGPRLEQYRATLRERVRASPLCNRTAFADRFGAALRAMWRAHCEKP